MGYAHQLVADYFRRRDVPPDSHLDGLYQYEMTVLRDTLDRLEVILDDEGVPREVAVRVIRCMLYGSPSSVAAEERMRREQAFADRLSREPQTVYVKPERYAGLRESLSSPLPPDLASALADEMTAEGQ